MQTALLLTSVFNLLAADVTIRIDRPTTNVTIITITLPEATQVQIQTNEAPATLDNSERLWGEIHEKEQRLLSIMKDVVRMLTNATPNAVQPVARSVLLPPDARASLPRAIPVPPMPFYVDAKRPFEATFVRPLPGGTNRSYSQHLEALDKASAKGLRRSQ